MSHITHEDIAKLGDLALLNLTEAEKENLVQSINSILGYVGMVAEVDLSQVQAKQNFTDIARPDVATTQAGSHNLVMSNAHQVSSEGFVEVSKVISK